VDRTAEGERRTTGQPRSSSRSSLFDLSRRPRTLIDPVAQAEFADRGYTVVDFLGDAALDELLELCRRYHRSPLSTWECDFYSEDPDCKEAVSSGIAGAFAEPMTRVFAGHRTFLHNFVLNWPGPDGGLELHEHSATVDERVYRSAVVWCALTDSAEENGTLHVVPRSHRMEAAPKAERGPSWFHGHEATLLRDHLDSVRLAPGQALVFDNALLHCSFPNITRGPRITAVATVAPAGAGLRYFDWSTDTGTTAYELDPTFFLDNVQADLQWSTPRGLTELGSVESREWHPTASEVGALLPRGNCGRHGEPARRSAPS
jgi:hypothetical protein